MTKRIVRSLTLCSLALAMAGSGCVSRAHQIGGRRDDSGPGLSGVHLTGPDGAAVGLAILAVGALYLLARGVAEIASSGDASPAAARTFDADVDAYCLAGAGRPDPTVEVPEYLKPKKRAAVSAR